MEPLDPEAGEARRAHARGPVRRVARRAVRAAVALLAVYGVATMAEVWWFGRKHDNRAADAIVLMGAAQWDGRPSPVLRERLKHVAELYERGIAPLIVVTGGRLPADVYTEAAVSRQYLVEHGVPDDAIVGEDEGRTSWQELQTVAALLKRRTGKARPAVTLVSDPYHQRRIIGMAGEVGLDPRTSPRSTRHNQEPWLPVHYAQEAVGVGLAHLVGYHNLVWLDR